MICKICGKEFQLNGKRGGQNRIVCYECLPECSDRLMRNTMRRRLLTEYGNKIKVYNAKAQYTPKSNILTLIIS